MYTPSDSQRPSVSERVAALASATLAIGGLLLLPFLAATEPDAGNGSVTVGEPSWWIVLAVILVQTAALLWVKRSPRMMLALIAVIPAAHAILVPGATFSLVTIAVSFAVFWAVIREPLRRVIGVLPAVVVLVAAAQVVNDVRGGAEFDMVTGGGAFLQAVSVVGLPLVIGMFFAARNDARVSRANEMLALQRERDAHIQAAVSRERMSMSRELHDIAAHHMSGIALLASAIFRQVDVDPEAAKISAQQVRAQSTTVLDDLRRVIGLLRDEAESNRSVETLAAVGELVDFRIAAGLTVDLVLLTAEHELGAGIGPLAQLVAYRMVQESLANAAVHAPGANCVVELDDRAAGLLTVLVSNDGSHAPDLGPGNGFGLLGMRERAELVDGELHYGATADGGWEVRLSLPRDAIISDVTKASP